MVQAEKQKMAKQNLIFRRGATYKMSYTHPYPMTGGNIYFTVKPVKYDSDATDSTATIAKTVTSFTVNGTRADWTLTDSDTQKDPGKYHYDIVYEDSAGESLPPLYEGSVRIKAKQTNRNV